MLWSVRWNKVLRDAWQHKAKSLLVILAIALGVATFGMLLTARQAAIRDMYAGYWANVPPGVILYLEPFDRDLLPVVRKMPEVAEAEARAVVYARVRAPESDEWKNLQLIVIEDDENSRISKVRSEEGDWPPPRREIVLERSSAVLLDFAIGGDIVVEMPGGVQKELRVAGTAHEFDAFSSYISQWAQGYVTLNTLEWLGQPPLYNQLYLTVSENAMDAAHLEQVRDKITDRLERSGYRVTGFDDYLTRPGKHWAYDFFSALMLVLGAVGVLSLLLSGFLVMNTTMALLAQETRQIGVMKALGGQRGQIVGIYMATVALYGGLALLVAVPLGLLCGYWFANFGSHVMNYDIVSYGLVPWVLGLQVLTALGVPALAALIPVYRGTRQTVREAISDYGIDSVESGALDRLTAKLRGLPRPLMLSLRNTFRRKTRLALTLLTLSLAGAILIGVLSTRDSMLKLLDDMFLLYDYHVEIFFSSPVRQQRIEAIAARVPGITYVESWVTLDAREVETDGDLGLSLDCYGLPLDQQTVHPTIVDGRWLLPEDGRVLVVSTGLTRDRPDLQVGSEWTVEINNRESTWTIVGVMLAQDQRAYAQSSVLSRAARLSGQATRAVFRVEQADDPAAHKAIARALEEHYDRAGLPVSVSQVIDELLQANLNQGNLITVLLMVMAALLAVVGGLGLGATMGLNVLDRTREIGVLRAIGASNGSMWGIILAEGLVIGTLSWILGTLLAVGARHFLA